MDSVKSWAELISRVKECERDLSCRYGSEVWYRGQCDADYVLLPSLLRAKNGISKEKAIFEEYKRYSQRISHEHKTDWELLTDMQHYFIPTRLLDWTESLGIALYFAVANRKDGKDISLYILNPWKLNALSSKISIPIVTEEPRDFSYTEIYLNKKPFAPVNPIAIKADYCNDRILAQRGMFTVHGDDTSPIEKLCADAVKKIDISEEAVPEIQDFLRYANIDDFTVYPDFYGLANHIKYELRF